jgi:bifunctional non-homologous end joining protein LigD
LAKRTVKELRVGSRTLEISNIEKVFYPSTGFTKGELIDYYIRIAPVLLPHLKNRPITLKRFPNGTNGMFFYEKRCPAYRPDWVTTAAVWSEGTQSMINFCVINDLPTLAWAANLAVIEFHSYLHTSKDITRPTYLAFDLDPGAPADIISCAEVALWIRDLLKQLGLQSLVKTSGSKGLQIYVPLNSKVTYDQTKPFARAIADLMQREHKKQVVSNMRKDLRKGKVLIDWSQNDDHKTTVSVYSMRAKERPTISTPLLWEEVESAAAKRDAGRLAFEQKDIMRRVEKHGDLFEPVLKMKQKLPKLEL